MAAGPSSSGITASQLSDIVECPICYSIYDKPCQLSCGHTLCASCIDRLVESTRNQIIAQHGGPIPIPLPNMGGLVPMNDPALIPHDFPMVIHNGNGEVMGRGDVVGLGGIYHQRNGPIMHGQLGRPIVGQMHFRRGVPPQQPQQPQNRRVGIEIKCPECRKPTFVPPEGLPVNYRVQDIVAKMSTQSQNQPQVRPRCKVCEENLLQGVYFECRQCGEDGMQLCSTCAIRAHNGHDIVEKRAITEVEIKDMKEKISQRTGMAFEAIETLQPKLTECSSIINEHIFKTLQKTTILFEQLAASFDQGQETIHSVDAINTKIQMADQLAELYTDAVRRVDDVLLQRLKDTVNNYMMPFKTKIRQLGLTLERVPSMERLADRVDEVPNVEQEPYDQQVPNGAPMQQMDIDGDVEDDQDVDEDQDDLVNAGAGDVMVPLEIEQGDVVDGAMIPGDMGAGDVPMAVNRHNAEHAVQFLMQRERQRDRDRRGVVQNNVQQYYQPANGPMRQNMAPPQQNIPQNVQQPQNVPQQMMQMAHNMAQLQNINPQQRYIQNANMYQMAAPRIVQGPPMGQQYQQAGQQMRMDQNQNGAAQQQMNQHHEQQMHQQQQQYQQMRQQQMQQQQMQQQQMQQQQGGMMVMGPAPGPVHQQQGGPQYVGPVQYGGPGGPGPQYAPHPPHGPPQQQIGPPMQAHMQQFRQVAPPGQYGPGPIQEGQGGQFVGMRGQQAPQNGGAGGGQQQYRADPPNNGPNGGQAYVAEPRRVPAPQQAGQVVHPGQRRMRDGQPAGQQMAPRQAPPPQQNVANAPNNEPPRIQNAAQAQPEPGYVREQPPAQAQPVRQEQPRQFAQQQQPQQQQPQQPNGERNDVQRHPLLDAPVCPELRRRILEAHGRGMAVLAAERMPMRNPLRNGRPNIPPLPAHAQVIREDGHRILDEVFRLQQNQRRAVVAAIQANGAAENVQRARAEEVPAPFVERHVAAARNVPVPEVKPEVVAHEPEVRNQQEDAETDDSDVEGDMFRSSQVTPQNSAPTPQPSDEGTSDGSGGEGSSQGAVRRELRTRTEPLQKPKPEEGTDTIKRKTDVLYDRANVLMEKISISPSSRHGNASLHEGEASSMVREGGQPSSSGASMPKRPRRLVPANSADDAAQDHHPEEVTMRQYADGDQPAAKKAKIRRMPESPGRPAAVARRPADETVAVGDNAQRMTTRSARTTNEGEVAN